MDIFLAWMLFLIVDIAVVMSPGPAFVALVRNAMVYDRKISIATALGLALGVAVHVILVLGGIAFLITKSVFLFNVIKYGGAGYLIYVGVKSLRTGGKHVVVNADEGHVRAITVRQAVFQGFLTNLLNPKAVVFFTAVFAQFIHPSMSFSVQMLYGFTPVCVEFIWFTGLSIILTNTSIKRMFMNVIHWVERLCGGLMIGLGVKLALFR